MDTVEFVGYAISNNLSYNEALREAKQLNLKFVRKEKYLIAKKVYSGNELTNKQKDKIELYKNEIDKYIKEAKIYDEIYEEDDIEEEEEEEDIKFKLYGCKIYFRTEGYSDITMKIEIDIGRYDNRYQDDNDEIINIFMDNVIDGLIEEFGNNLGFTGGVEVREPTHKYNYTDVDIFINRSDKAVKAIKDIISKYISRIEEIRVM